MQHTWKIYDLKRNIADGVVIEVTYACESTHEQSGTRQIGNITLSGSASDSGFIDFDSLTEGKVLEWVYSSVDKSSIETSNSASIAQSIIIRAKRTTKRGTPWD